MSKGIWGGLKKAAPAVLGLNLFVLLAPFVAYQPFKRDVTQTLYFVYGIIVLFILSLFSKPKRSLKFGLGGIFLLWALAMMLIHSKISDSSVTYRYLNFYLMSEGFIYLLFAVLLYKLVYGYADSLPCLWIALGIFLVKAIAYKSFTPIASFAICSLIYTSIKKRYLWALIISILSGIFITSNYSYILAKWSCRIPGWLTTIKEIAQYPFIGSGFDTGLMNNMIQGATGWVFRHNDYLNIAKDLGLPALMMIGVFLFGFFRKFRCNPLYLACLACLLMSFFQTNLYNPRWSAVVIPLFALTKVRYG